MKSGDVILSVDGKPLKDSKTLPHMVAKIKPGTRAPFKVFRDGKEVTLNIEIGKMSGEDETGSVSSSAPTVSIMSARRRLRVVQFPEVSTGDETTLDRDLHDRIPGSSHVGQIKRLVDLRDVTLDHPG